MITQIVYRKGNVALVQWIDRGKLKRGYLPTDQVVGVAEAFIKEKELRMAVPYGDPWEDMVTLKATSADLAANLRKSGIWTVADLRANPDAAVGALHATYGIDYHTLLMAANNFDGGKNE